MKKPARKLTRWAKWYRLRRAKHLCPRCGKKAGKYIECDKCHDHDLAQRRLKYRAKVTRPFLQEEWTTPLQMLPDLETEKLTEAAPIVYEICERLHELEDIRLGLAIDIMSRLTAICEVSHMAFRYTIRLMHGDATIFSSFQEQAEDRAMSKQAAHAEFHVVIATIERVFPELSKQIEFIRGQVSRAEEPSTGRTNPQGQVVTAEREARV
jgi:hypothetical protein